jgi:hypothetical protein
MAVRVALINQIALLLQRFKYHIVSIDFLNRTIIFRKSKGNVWQLSIFPYDGG